LAVRGNKKNKHKGGTLHSPGSKKKKGGKEGAGNLKPQKTKTKRYIHLQAFDEKRWSTPGRYPQQTPTKRGELGSLNATQVPPDEKKKTLVGERKSTATTVGTREEASGQGGRVPTKKAVAPHRTKP